MNEVDKTNAQIKAMEALFAFAEAMEEGSLTTADLIDVMSTAVADGFDMLIIGLTMASFAANRVKEKRSA